MLLPYRVRNLERDVTNIKEWRERLSPDLAVRDEHFKGMDAKVAQLSEAVDKLRAALVASALTVAGSSVLFAIGTMVATGKI